MKAILLAGGFATRLRPLSCTRPKPLFPVLGKPIMSWILEALDRSGVIDEVIVSVRYMSHMIESAYGDKFGRIRLQYVRERAPLGDGGPLRLIHSKIPLDSTFIVFNGDIVTDVDIKRVVEFHKKHGGIATIVLSAVEDVSRYGVALLDDDGRIVQFVEKPKKGEVRSNLVNAGIYVFEPEVLKYVPEPKKVKIAVDILPKLVERGELYGYVHNGFWLDIGVPTDYMRANFILLERLYPQSYIDPTAEIGKDVEIVHPVYIGKNTVIEGGSKIGPYTVLMDNVTILGNTRISRSVVLNECYIGPAAVVKGSILGERVVVGRWSVIEENNVLGDGVVVGDEVTVSPGNKICPYKELYNSVHNANNVIL